MSLTSFHALTAARRRLLQFHAVALIALAVVALAFTASSAMALPPPSDGTGGGGPPVVKPQPKPPVQPPAVTQPTQPDPAPQPPSILTPQIPEQPLTAITAGPQYNKVSQYIRMNSTVRLSRGSDRVDGTTHTWNSSIFNGGRGLVAAYFLDVNGNIIGASNAHEFGVGAKPWDGPDRTDDWSDWVPREITRRTASIEIHHTSGSRDNFQRTLNIIKLKGCLVFGLLLQSCPFR